MTDKPQLIIFDFDGTIADTLSTIVRICNRLAGEFKFKIIREEDMKILKHATLDEIIRFLNVPALKIPLILKRSREELNGEIDQIQPFKGLRSSLMDLRESGFELGIITTNSLQNVKRFLENHELDQFAFVSSSSKIWGKNHALKRAQKKWKRAPEDVIYIGDEIRDIVAARKAGARIISVSWGYNSAKSLKTYRPDYLVHNPRELFQACIETRRSLTTNEARSGNDPTPSHPPK